MVATKKKNSKPIVKKNYKVAGFVVGGVTILGVAGLIYLLKRKNDSSSETNTNEGKTTIINNYNAPTTSKKTTTKTSSSPVVAEIPATASMNADKASKVAEQIRRATYINKRDDYGNNWPILVNALATIKNIKDYELVNKEYLKIGFVSKTIVTHLLSTFGQFNAYRLVLTKEFLRIGLKQSADGKWSLNGLGNLSNTQGRGVITIAPVIALVNNKRANQYFEQGVVIGHELSRANGVSKILTPRKNIIYAPSQSLAYL